MRTASGAVEQTHTPTRTYNTPSHLQHTQNAITHNAHININKTKPRQPPSHTDLSLFHSLSEAGTDSATKAKGLGEDVLVPRASHRRERFTGVGVTSASTPLVTWRTAPAPDVSPALRSRSKTIIRGLLQKHILILWQMGKNKGYAHLTPTYFHTCRVSI